MTLLESRSEQPEVQPPCFKPVVTEPRAKVSFRRPNGHDRDHAVPQLIAVNPPVPEIEVTDYDSLLDVLRRRADSLQISRSTIDNIARLQEGYSAKLLSLNKLRRIGAESMGPLLDALCLKLIAVPDDEAFARNQSKMIRRDDAHFRSARAGHDANPRPARARKRTPGGRGKKSVLAKISGAITGRMFGYPAP